MNYDKLGKLIGEKIKGATDSQRFRFATSLLQDNPYGWAAENLFRQDCSGSLAFGLLVAGYNVRLTADGFFRLVFTQDAAGFDAGEIQAIFYIAKSDRKHGDRTASKGEVVHVTPVVGDDAVMDAAWGQPARIRSVIRAEAIHRAYGTTPILRSADWQKLETLHLSGKYPVDDAELSALM